MGVTFSVLLLSVLGGLIVSAFYMSQFYYTSVCAHLDNTSMYFGVNMGIVQCANILGNVLSTYTIGPLGELRYTVMMTGLVLGIALMFLGVREAGGKEDLVRI
jgi:hypothetical protein